MQKQAAVDALLQNVDEKIKDLKSNIDEAVVEGETQNAEQWMRKINTCIQQLDHLVEKLETTEK